MIIQADKEKVLDEFKRKYVEGRFYEESSKIYDDFENRKDIIKSTIISQFKEGCKNALKLQS